MFSPCIKTMTAVQCQSCFSEMSAGATIYNVYVPGKPRRNKESWKGESDNERI